MVINWVFPDTNQQVRMNLENSVLTHAMGKQAANADATVTLNRSTLDLITLRQKTFPQAIEGRRREDPGQRRATAGAARHARRVQPDV